MLNNELKRNGSGYYDGTPYNAVLCNPEAGDVYESSLGKTYLVLKNHGRFSIALALFESPSSIPGTDYGIKFGENETMYSNPAMLQYVFNDIFRKRAGILSESTFLDVMENVGESLGVTVKVSKEHTDEQAKLIDKLNKEKQELAVKLDALRYKASANQDAALYKHMYYELLDRIIGKGGVIGER